MAHADPASPTHALDAGHKAIALQQLRSLEVAPQVQVDELHTRLALAPQRLDGATSTTSKRFCLTKLLQRNGLVTGIKGMSGRGGIGMGHRADFTGSLDVTGSVLRQWVGSDASRYEGQP